MATRTARSTHTLDEAIDKLRELSDEKNLKGMSRYAIDTSLALGVSMPNIRSVGKGITKDHELAQQLWDSGIHEARILASLVDKPEWVSEQQMDLWVKDFNSWDLCDQVCGNLFCRTEFTKAKVFEWSEREEEFVKRAAFALIAWESVHNKKAEDSYFLVYLPLIRKCAIDERNFVKKAVNWALRQMGKRSVVLHRPALDLSKELMNSDDKSARWIGTDAVRELDGKKVRFRLGI